MKLPAFLQRLFQSCTTREKRRYPRVKPVDLRFKVLDPEYKTALMEKAELRNLSNGGCCFLCDKWIPERAHLYIVLGIPDGSQMHKVEVNSEAVRVIRLEGGGFEIGAAFFTIFDPKAKTLLQDYIMAIQKKAEAAGQAELE